MSTTAWGMTQQRWVSPAHLLSTQWEENSDDPSHCPVTLGGSPTEVCSLSWGGTSHGQRAQAPPGIGNYTFDQVGAGNACENRGGSRVIWPESLDLMLC